MHQEKVKNKITNYWLRAITFGLSNKKQNVTVGRKCSVSCHFCEVQPSQAKDAGAGGRATPVEGGDGVPLRRRALRRGGALHFGVLETSAGDLRSEQSLCSSSCTRRLS